MKLLKFVESVSVAGGDRGGGKGRGSFREHAETSKADGAWDGLCEYSLRNYWARWWKMRLRRNAELSRREIEIPDKRVKISRPEFPKSGAPNVPISLAALIWSGGSQKHGREK